MANRRVEQLKVLADASEKFRHENAVKFEDCSGREFQVASFHSWGEIMKHLEASIEDMLDL